MAISKKRAVIADRCVACGSCVKACPLRAISVYKGMYAEVDNERCAGCGKCVTACPASVISIATGEDISNEA